MKKITTNFRLLVSILSFIVLTFSSCQEEMDVAHESLAQKDKDYSLSNELMKSVTEFNGILVFKDENTSRKIFTELNSLKDEYIKSVRKEYENEDDFNSAVINGEININLVYENFENNFSYTSMRKKIADEESTWLMNRELDFMQQPNFIISDNTIRTMINSGGEYAIGAVIYKIAENGVIYGVEEIDYGSLLDLRGMLKEDIKASENISENIFIAQANGNVENLPVSNKDLILKSTNDLDLRGNESREIVYSYDDGDRYLKGRVTITNVVGISNFVKSETETYEYKGWLIGWSRINMHQWARVKAVLYWHYEGDWVICRTVDESDWDDDKQAQADHSEYPYRIRVASGGLEGQFKSEEVAVQTKLVEW